MAISSYSKKKLFLRKVAVVFILFLGFFLIYCRGVAKAISSNTQSERISFTKQNLQEEIQYRSKLLQEIEQKLEETRQDLKKTQSQKSSLQKELNSIEQNIEHLNLSAKADEIAIQKLSLEIDFLNYDLRDIEASINNKKKAIARILKKLQSIEDAGDDLLLLLLKKENLADAVFEKQTLNDLQFQLTIDIPNFQFLQREYNNKLKEANAKKESIIFHRKNKENKKLIIEEQKKERTAILEQTKNQEKVYQKQMADLLKLQQQIADEIEALGSILRAKIDPSLLPPPAKGILGMPIKEEDGSITQDYGATNFAKYGYRGKWHNGIDIGAPLGTPVFAAEDGEVVAIGNQDNHCYKGAYGKFIVINHRNNLTTLYAHLSRQIVKKGDNVKRGELIGYVGKTGYATGPHLHFTVFAQPTYYLGSSKNCGPMPSGGDLNPLIYL